MEISEFLRMFATLGGGVSSILVFILTGDGYIVAEEKIKIGLYGDNGEVDLCQVLLVAWGSFIATQGFSSCGTRAQ